MSSNILQLRVEVLEAKLKEIEPVLIWASRKIQSEQRREQQEMQDPKPRWQPPIRESK
jgi:hypothetical protein